MTVSDETWKPIPGYSGYEASDMGRIRSIDRVDRLGRRLTGQLLNARENNRGYMMVKITDDAGRKQTRSVHRLILMTFVGPCPDGQETRHGPGGPLDNRLANICYGTPAQNAADKPVNGGKIPGKPTEPCRNAPTCGNLVMNEGRRCKECVAAVGRMAARMLNGGLNLAVVADRCGYETPAWVWKLAREFGVVKIDMRTARLQQPTLRQRAVIALRDRRENGWGDAA